VNGSLELATVGDFATALLIGAMIGIEREKRKAEGKGGTGGLRTFILFALVGAVAGFLSRDGGSGGGVPWLVVAALALVAALVLAGYVAGARARRDSLGLTTELAAVVVCLLGAMTMLGHRELATGLGVVAAAVLAYKQPLHGLVARLGWDDVHAGVRLLVATFVILPLLPNAPVDPWGALNPYRLWLLVILISGLSLVGYVATRWLGAGRGTALTGLTGGLVSSTAVTLAFARRGREEPGAAAALACGILIAWAVMFGRVVVEVAVVNAGILAPVSVPFVAMGLVATGFAWLFYRRAAAAAGRGGPDGGEVPLENPFSLTAAAKFAAFFALVLVLVKGVQLHLPGQGVYLVAALAGLTDVDAITLSMAEYAKAGDPETAVAAIVIAALTNTAVKCGAVVLLSGGALQRPILLVTGTILAAGAASAAVERAV
jgi:uncharacterized membrane protein (DUF4010 family)